MTNFCIFFSDLITKIDDDLTRPWYKNALHGNDYDAIKLTIKITQTRRGWQCNKDITLKLR